MTQLAKRWRNLSDGERTALIVLGGLAVVATGGAVAYAVAGSEALLVAAGPVVIATGKAAEELAKRSG